MMNKVFGLLVGASVSAASFAGVLSPEVEAAIAANPQGHIDAIVYVAAPPPFLAAQAAKAEFGPQIRALGDEVKAIARTQQLRGLSVLEIAHRRTTLFELDSLYNERGARIAEALRESASANVATVQNAVESFGGVASEPSYILPSLRAHVPASVARELATHSLVTYIDIHFVGGPLLDNQRVSLGVNTSSFWANGYTGGAFDVGLIDTGVHKAHPAFNGLGWEGVTTDPDGHGTGVGGMMFSNDATYRGLAYGLDTVCAADAETGMRESSDWLLTQTFQRPEAINVSWGGQSPDPNEYQSIEAWYDSAGDTFEILFGQAAGNEGGSGYQSLVSPAKAYNTIAVANVYDNNTTTRTDDVIQGSSSRGPTPNGRKKPDIAAPGHNTRSTNRTNGFSDLGGTSSAAPKVTAAAVLLRDFGTTSSITEKAVLINSADSWSDNNTVDGGDDGPINTGHWSRSYGWGYMNLLKAYQQAPYAIEREFARPIFVGGRRLMYFVGARSSGFKATLVWNRHTLAYTGEDPLEVHSLTNFNLGLYSGSTGALVNQSTSTIDNVEQVWTNTSGSGVLKVHTTGNWDIDVPTENWSLSVPGLFAQVNPPQLAATVNVPEYAVVGSEISVMGNVTNNGGLHAFDTLASINAHVVGGTNPAQLGTLDPGETGPVNWAAEVNQSPGPQTIRLSTESSCYGETYTTFAEDIVTVIPFYLAPTSYQLVRGILSAGNLSSVTSNNNVRMELKPGITFTTSQWPVEVIFRGTSPVASPQHFYVRTDSNASSPSIRQKTEVYNYNNSTWVQLDDSNMATTDVTKILPIPGTASHFQHPTTREIQIRLSAKAFGPVFAYPWIYRIDQVGWHIDD